MEESINIKNTADLSFCSLVNNQVFEYMLMIKVFDKIVNENLAEKNKCVCVWAKYWLGRKMQTGKTGGSPQGHCTPSGHLLAPNTCQHFQRVSS